jgi:thiosulfate/3-mercaptopyruvate sulfurtransferase
MHWKMKAVCLCVCGFVLAGGFGLSAAAAKTGAPAHPEALVNAQWMQQHAQDSDVVVIDASDVKDDTYVAQSINGAVCMPYRDLRQDSGLMKGISYGLEKEDFDPSALEAMFRQAGVNRDSTVVLAAQYRVDDAAMVFWTLKWLGHEDVRLLPVNYLKVLPESMLTSELEQWSEHGGNGNFAVQPDWSWYATRNDVLDAMHSGGAALIDVRSAPYFEGKKTKTIRGGTLATAKNWPFDQAWTGQDMAEVAWDCAESSLAELLAAEDEDKADMTMITFCNSGHTAGAGFFIWQCGYEWALCDASWNVIAYDGSVPAKNLNLYLKP